MSKRVLHKIKKKRPKEVKRMANYNYQGSFLQKTNCNDQEKTRILTARGYRSRSEENKHHYCQRLYEHFRRTQASLLLELIEAKLYIYKLADGNNELLNKDQVLQA